MTSAVETRTNALDAAASRALSERMGDTPAVAAVRAAAASALATLPMPTRRDRPWKYMDISELDFGAYQPAVEGDFTIVAPSLEGLTAVAFSGAPDDAKAIIDRHLASAVPAAKNRLVALHYAFLR